MAEISATKRMKIFAYKEILCASAPEGRVLGFLLALYSFGVSGYVTATLATYFIGQDAIDDEAELASAKSIHAAVLPL
jgi:hypothetical protein